MRQRTAEEPTQKAAELAQLLREQSVEKTLVFTHKGPKGTSSFFLKANGEWHFQDESLRTATPDIFIMIAETAMVTALYGRLTLEDYAHLKTELQNQLDALKKQSLPYEELEEATAALFDEYEPLLEDALDAAWEFLCATMTQILLEKIAVLEQQR